MFIMGTVIIVKINLSFAIGWKYGHAYFLWHVLVFTAKICAKKALFFQ